MKTVYKLILKSYLGPMILTFFIVIFILLMNFLWRYIDELAGKNIDTMAILELLMYAGISAIPMGLPLATLLASIMTMGDLGENYELLAMKSAGMSLVKIMRPLIVVVFVISIGGFYVANNLVPYATQQMNALIYDIRRMLQQIEFQDGLFFNGIPDMSIRVDSQDPQTGLLRDVLIYDNRNGGGNMSTTLADSGYIRLSDDKRFLLVTLFNGESYEMTRGSQWDKQNELTRNIYSEQNVVGEIAGYDLERTDADLFNQSNTKRMDQLSRDIDSLQRGMDGLLAQAYGPLFNTYIFPNDQTLAVDSLRKAKSDKPKVVVADSIALLDVDAKYSLWSAAANSARSSRSMFTRDEAIAKENLNELYKSEYAWYGKLVLPVSIMVFFLIGAPLGAIIRRGGLGMPIVVSVGFFVIYYVILLMGERMATEGTWIVFVGSWMPPFVLLPVAIFLIYKSTNDSNLFNADWYIMKLTKLRDRVNERIQKTKKQI